MIELGIVAVVVFGLLYGVVYLVSTGKQSGRDSQLSKSEGELLERAQKAKDIADATPKRRAADRLQNEWSRD